MASSVSEDSLDSDIFNLNNSSKINERFFVNYEEENVSLEDAKSNLNIVHKITNRQVSLNNHS